MSEALHPEEIVTTFILIRHGHTAQTEAGKLYSDPESVLTEKGRDEVHALAKLLPHEKPEVLLTSPSVRVRSTAEVIGKVIGMEARVVESLREFQVGDWEGKSYLEIKKAEPEVYAKWSKDPIRNALPGGESIEQLCRRVKAEMQRLVAEHSGRRVLLVSHAELIRAILLHALELPLDNYYRIAVPTASMSKVDFSANFATLHYSGVNPRVFASTCATM
jgi:ribonuclease H / adenosylcobalamin/alpha-ribazole phosphatase